ncbi:unnamed protein product, partial [Phaeothamnion confervicola]
WHRRFGHAVKGVDTAEKRGLIKLLSGHFGDCTACDIGKSTRQPTPRTTLRECSTPLEVVYVDLAGPIQPAGRYAQRYIAQFTCGKTSFRWAYPIVQKSDAIKALGLFLDEVDLTDHRVRCLRSDNGGEFTGRVFREECLRRGVRQEFSAPRTPEQMGKAESGWRVAGNATRATLADCGVDTRFWPEAYEYSIYALNRLATRALPGGLTPYEAFYGRPPSTAHMRAFGAQAIVHYPSSLRPGGKFGPRGFEGIMMGYGKDGAGYLVYVPSKGEIIRSKDVKFNENVFPSTSGGLIHPLVAFSWPEEDADGEDAAGGTGAPP